MEWNEYIVKDGEFIDELIRCWDCIYWEPATLSSGNCKKALKITAYKDDFCSYAEREDRS